MMGRYHRSFIYKEKIVVKSWACIACGVRFTGQSMNKVIKKMNLVFSFLIESTSTTNVLI